MRITMTACTLIAGMGLLLLPDIEVSHTSITSLPPKADSGKTDMVPSLIVPNAPVGQAARRYNLYPGPHHA
jgi:hypothetical protein